MKCASYWELRGALRAGDVWLEGSRRYANPETYLIPSDQWAVMRTATCRLVQVPESGIERLRECQQELEARLSQFDKGLPANSQVRIEKGELIVSPLRAEDLPNTHQHSLTGYCRINRSAGGGRWLDSLQSAF